MLSQQLKSTHSLQSEVGDDPSSFLSDAVANNNYFSTTPTTSPTSSSSIGSSTDRRPLILRDIFGFNNSPSSIGSMTDRRSLNSIYCDICNNLSQSTRFRFGSGSTLLDKLWYTYSYIYKSAATTTATTFYKPILALLFLLLILMPTTSSALHQQSSIVSPSPNPLSRSRSFTMANYIAITQLYFIFGPHYSPKYEFLDTALNNVYFEPIDDAVLASLFTDANKTAFQADPVDLISSAIVNIIVTNRRADRSTIEPLLALMPLSATVGLQKNRVNIRSNSTTAFAF